MPYESPEAQRRTDFDAVCSFLPNSVIQCALVKAEERKDPPFLQSFYAIALFGDVAGFTRLSKKECDKGSHGCERLQSMLNAYFQLIGWLPFSPLFPSALAAHKTKLKKTQSKK